MKLVLAGLAALLLGVLLLQWSDWDARPSLSVGADDGAQGTQAAPDALPNAADLLTPPAPQEEYASIIERPLFLPDRRLPQEEVDQSVTAEEDAAPVDESAVQGIDFNAVLLSAETNIAWIRLPKEPKLRRIREGDLVNGWTVADIRADRLSLRYQEAEKQIILRDYANAPKPIPPTRLPRPPAASNRPESVPGDGPSRGTDSSTAGNEAPPGAHDSPSESGTDATSPGPPPTIGNGPPPPGAPPVGAADPTEAKKLPLPTFGG